MTSLLTLSMNYPTDKEIIEAKNWFKKQEEIYNKQQRIKKLGFKIICGFFNYKYTLIKEVST